MTFHRGVYRDLSSQPHTATISRDERLIYTSTTPSAGRTGGRRPHLLNYQLNIFKSRENHTIYCRSATARYPIGFPIVGRKIPCGALSVQPRSMDRPPVTAEPAYRINHAQRIRQQRIAPSDEGQPIYSLQDLTDALYREFLFENVVARAVASGGTIPAIAATSCCLPQAAPFRIHSRLLTGPPISTTPTTMPRITLLVPPMLFSRLTAVVDGSDKGLIIVVITATRKCRTDIKESV